MRTAPPGDGGTNWSLQPSRHIINTSWPAVEGGAPAGRQKTGPVRCAKTRPPTQCFGVRFPMRSAAEKRTRHRATSHLPRCRDLSVRCGGRKRSAAGARGDGARGGRVRRGGDVRCGAGDRRSARTCACRGRRGDGARGWQSTSSSNFYDLYPPGRMISSH